MEEYKEGVTPNPCVVCNKEIKFGFLLEKSLALDADFLATGHYVRKIQNQKSPEGNPSASYGAGKIQKLLKGKDKEKDQSYFLWKLESGAIKKSFISDWYLF